MYLAPQNIPRAISVLTLGNRVILYSTVLCVPLCMLVCACVPNEKKTKTKGVQREKN